MLLHNARSVAFAFLALPGFLVLVACGSPDSARESQSDVKIVGGSKVSEVQDDPRRYSTVALTTDAQGSDRSKPPLLDQGVSFCTGTIIGPRTILTAAHCLEKFDQRSGRKQGLLLPSEANYLAFFGTRVSKTGKVIRAARVIPHPEWDPKSTLQPSPRSAPNDIGIVVLSEDVPEGYKPVALAEPSLDLRGKPVYLAGFGVPFSRAAGNTGTLRQVDMRLTNADGTAKRLAIGGGILRGACAGDSGGPAYIREGNDWKVVGATSTGAEILTACIGVVNNYTDARQYASWIASVTR